MMFRKLIIVAICLSIFACSGTKQQQAKSIKFADNIVVAHRGAWKAKGLPENSIAALKEAIRLNCTGSEFDVHMTADDSLIINHDPHYHGLKVEESTYAQLAKFTLSNGEKLPTLREYILAGLKNNNSTRLVCEIKPSGISKARGQIIVKKAYDLVQSLQAQPMVAYISFDYNMTQTLAKLNPTVSVQYLEANKAPKELLADGINGIDYHLSAFKKHPDWIAQAKANNITLNAWTVNDAKDMDWFIANEFDFITTNEPELLFKRIEASPIKRGYKLAWSDEFNTNGLPDTSKWGYAVGGSGFGNNELQYYTYADTNNAVVANGKLIIKALKQDREGKAYTSARLTTKNKASFTYGRVEVSAKLPKGRGTWPAIWMLGDKLATVGWPAGGEIDIMEHVGYSADSIHGTIHSTAYNHMKGTQLGKAIYIATPYTEFHQYTIEWTADAIDFMVDGVVYNHIKNEHKGETFWPFNSPFYLLINLAVGGNWGGKMGVDDTVFPANMEVEYVRVFEQ